MASHGHRGAQNTLCPSEGWLKRAVPGWNGSVFRGLPRGPGCGPGCVQGGALRCLCNAWHGASSHSEQRCHWLHISAGDLGQCWKRFSDASVRKPAQPLWPWESIPVASTATMGAIEALLITVSHRAVRVEHIPHLSSTTPESFNKRLRSLSGDRQTNPQYLDKDMGKLQLLHAIKRRGGHRGPGLGCISNPRSIPQPF